MKKLFQSAGTMIGKWKLSLIALPAFGMGLAATILVALLVARYQQAQILNEFTRDTARVSAQTETRLRAHFETLLSIKGLFAANENVDRTQFRSFLDQLELRRTHPGFQAIQFVRHVRGDQAEAYVRAVRDDRSSVPHGYPHFNIRPNVARPDHYVIEYTEPLEGNENAFGLDLASMPSHLTALELGRDTGKPVATERVKLVQDPLGQPAFVARVPIYRFGMPTDTVDQRRAALYGFAATVYRVNDLMKEVIDAQLVPHMRVRILDKGYADDSRGPRPGTIMFDSKEAYGGELAGQELSTLRSLRVLTVGQRRWELEFTAVEGARYGSTYSAIVGIILSGTVISALITALLVGLARHRTLAARLDRALQQQTAIVDNATVGIEMIRNRRIESCNLGMAEMLGYSVSELCGAPTRIKYVSDAAYAELGAGAYAALQAGKSWIGDVEWVRKDGEHIWCRLHGKSVEPGQPENGSIWVSYDITAQKRADAALIEANKGLEQSLEQIERTHADFTRLSEFSSYLQACPDLEAALDCIAGFAVQLFAGSAGAIYLLDETRQHLVQRVRWGQLPHELSQFPPSECWAMRRGQPNRTGTGRNALPCPHLCTGRAQPEDSVCLPLTAQASAFGLVYLDDHNADTIGGTDLRYRLALAWAEDIGLALANLRLRDTLRQQSIRDPLTGLFNRRHMNDVIGREFARARREDRQVAVALVDIDHFKRINDTHGHDAGDHVLVQVAHTIETQVRQGDIVCRYGGEEFIVILPDISQESVIERAEQMRQAVAALSFRNCDQPVGRVTVSLGVAMFPEHGENEGELVRAADAALYQAKETGRNRVVIAVQAASVSP